MLVRQGFHYLLNKCTAIIKFDRAIVVSRTFEFLMSIMTLNIENPHPSRNNIYDSGEGVDPSFEPDG